MNAEKLTTYQEEALQKVTAFESAGATIDAVERVFKQQGVHQGEVSDAQVPERSYIMTVDEKFILAMKGGRFGMYNELVGMGLKEFADGVLLKEKP